MSRGVVCGVISPHLYSHGCLCYHSAGLLLGESIIVCTWSGNAILIICNPDCLFPGILQAEVLKEPMQPEQYQPELSIAQPTGTQQAQHEAQQEAQPALQQPVLALLSSGLPPIVLGTFQGDMQRARIILEAAGFLIPFDISSSLLPPDLTSSSPLQHTAGPALPAVPALPAGLWTAQPATQQANPSSAEEEEGLLVQGAAASGAEQVQTEGSMVACHICTSS